MHTADEAKYIIQLQGNVRTECMKALEHVVYMVNLRAMALAGVLGLPNNVRNYGDFMARLESHFKPLNHRNITWHEKQLNKYCKVNSLQPYLFLS